MKTRTAILIATILVGNPFFSIHSKRHHVPVVHPAPMSRMSPVRTVVTTTTTTTEPVAIQPPPRNYVDEDAISVDTPDWKCIRFHESTGVAPWFGNYTDYNGGAYQFEDGTWSTTTGLPGSAEDYPPAVQDAAALKLFAERGFEPWSTRWDCGLG